MSVTICNTSNEPNKAGVMTQKDVLTADEVAEYLRIHPYTVRRLARAGKLPGFRVGGQWQFNKIELDRLQKQK